MTIKELIKELERFPENCEVLVANPEDYPNSPSPFSEKREFDTTYWNEDGRVGKIKAGTEFVMIS